MVAFFVFVRLTNESNGEKILFEKKFIRLGYLFQSRTINRWTLEGKRFSDKMI